jgi:hypothetical protein
LDQGDLTSRLLPQMVFDRFAQSRLARPICRGR